MGEAGEQAGEQELLFLRGELAHVLAKRLCQYAFHLGVTVAE